MATYEDFKKIELVVAEIKSAEKIVGAEKLLKLSLDVGNSSRQIVAGIAKHYTPDELIGKKIILVKNLEPRNVRGVLSEGMLLAAVSDAEGIISLVTVDKDVKAGTPIL
ncbi:MAG: methionine--tRNA ligase subunit beta [Candidatus Micrarchaeia archaeon]